ncbi:MAG: hypothetical protein M1118_07245 [Chloroflexi bacterium]|nr:hypothetical protein [Chloroflexota bacterium]
MGIDLWNPSSGLPVGTILLTAFLLGVVHGLTPDEHTWPITFSYAIGSYSTRSGLLSGIAFSAAFAVQRSLVSVLAYLALARWFQLELDNGIVYVLVGLVMAVAGGYVLRVGHNLHLHLPLVGRGENWPGPVTDAAVPRPVTPLMAALHGFLAGFGVGAFAIILYTTLAPSMPSLVTSWLPGAAFGLGTMAVQAAAGAGFGWWIRRRHLPEQVGALLARRVAGMTLFWGGLAFTVAGLLTLFVASFATWQIRTPLHIHNLHHLGLGFVLVLLVVLGIGIGTLMLGLREATRYRAPSPAGSMSQMPPTSAP